MKKVITYGTFDLLHHGHVNLLRRAKELGDYLIVGVTSSDFDKNRGKINVKQSLMDRIEAVKALGIADEVIPEEYYGQKIDDIRNYDVDIFAIGSDWRGHFDYLNEYCQVVYLDRTEGISSTQLREGHNHIALGIVGASRDISKFIAESKYVSGIDIVALFPDGDDYDLGDAVSQVDSLEALLAECDAVYVANAPERRHATTTTALEAGKHVLCESPVALTAAEAAASFALAREKGLVFHEAVKTAYALAFSRLTLLIKSGMIGTPVSVRSTCTSQAFASPAGSLIGWGPIASLPIFEMLGTNYLSASAASLYSRKDGTDVFTKVDFIYEGACASFEVGSGVKSEGELVIAGTKGYVYVPSPWWKTDYFEVRFEDFSSNKRYFYQLNGEGIRDEISVFAKTIQDGKKPNLDITEEQTVALSGLIEAYRAGTMTVHNLGLEAKGTTISFFQN
ncbi:adenylyltransferase/cytidyltransferase family protein [Adlercreutzia equolifaciens]|uniref:adenylyltransferase/cytidyltransferase family protein n=1 Tax=Adlercreutzia equolifaciens TaxID=446660 RepID=UPI0031B5CF35